jgi:DNA-binding NarL/FixJ family response regulator
VIRVLVADDHEAFLEAARAVLAATAGVELAGLARSGEEAVALAAALRPDAVVLDINMPGMGGIEAARQIVAGHPSTRAVLVSTYGVDDLPAAARSSGAAYLHKEDFGPASLAAAVAQP